MAILYRMYFLYLFANVQLCVVAMRQLIVPAHELKCGVNHCHYTSNHSGK